MNLKFGWSRRSFLSLLGAATGGLFAPAELQAAGLFGKKPKAPTSVAGCPIVPITSGLGSGDIYEELGITPLININGTVTVIGGSVIAPQVMELMRRATSISCSSTNSRSQLESLSPSCASSPLATPSH